MMILLELEGHKRQQGQVKEQYYLKLNKSVKKLILRNKEAI